MTTRKASVKKIDPVQVCAIALRNVKTKSDYNRIGAANTQADLEQAWATLSEQEQTRIHAICNREPQPDINAIANDLARCTALIQLQAFKAEHGEETVRAAWRLLPVDERKRLKAICDGQKPVPEQPTEPEWNGAYTQELTEQWSEDMAKLSPAPTKQRARSLFSISDDLEKLNELLDECVDNDTEQQELINQWLEQLGEERDTKLDSYAALITEIAARTEVRKAEAKRMMDLAAADEKRARLLKDRLRWFFEAHRLKTVETARYKLTLTKNGGKQPLVLKEGVSPAELPEQFQKVSIDLNTTAIREALEAGEQLDFATLGDRGSSIRIK